MEVPSERLRQQLQVAHPGLYAALLRNWQVASDEWLPALGAKSDSFNSYPHIRNVEHYLDRLVLADEGADKAGEDRMRVRLSPVEIYVLLAAALFHDIGRVEEQQGSDNKKTEGDRHGLLSREVIEKRHANLGIPSLELARSIGRVCAYHDFKPDRGGQQGGDGGNSSNSSEQKEVPGREWHPQTVAVDPYGEIRELVLAVLLYVADHMDSASTRVMPVYLRPPGKIEVVGAFRRVITGVEADHKCHVVRTVLGSVGEREREEKGKKQQSAGQPARGAKEQRPKAPDGAFRYRMDEGDTFLGWANKAQEKGLNRTGLLNKTCDVLGKLPVLGSSVAPQEGLIRDVLVSLLKGNDPGTRYLSAGLPAPMVDDESKDKESQRVLVSDNVPLLARVLDEDCAPLQFDEWLLVLGQVKLVPGEKDPKVKPDEDRWPARKILAVIMGDVLNNVRALAAVQERLAIVGTPLRAWLIEFKEHLFNIWGEETFEPIFTREHLREVAERMWNLSTQIFGQSLFTYENLADDLRESDVDKVRKAVRRVAIVTRGLGAPEAQDAGSVGRTPEDAIWAGDRQWRWNTGDHRAGEKEALPLWCRVVSLEKVLGEIEKLGRPV